MVENNSIFNGGSEMIRSNISNLSDELLIEILCRLGSSKWATRCKSICKRWFSIIDTNSSPNSYFIRCWRKMHCIFNEEDDDEELPIALLTQYRRDWMDEDRLAIDYPFSAHYQNLPSFNFMPLQDTKTHIYILDTYKDLMVYCLNKHDHSVYYLCNPFTGQWTALPPPPPLPGHYLACGVRVKFIISNKNGNRSKFKLARVITLKIVSTCDTPKPDNVKRFKVEIFSSREDGPSEWKEIVNVPGSLYHSRAEMMVWLSSSELFLFNSSQEIIGLKFADSDFDVNGYTRFSVPSGYETHGSGSLIGVCRGCLRIAQVVHTFPPSYGNENGQYGQKLIIWELNGSSWNLVHDLDFSEVEDSEDSSKARKCYQKGVFRASILGFDPHDRDMVYLCWFFYLQEQQLGTSMRSYIFSCNVRRRTLKLIRKLPGLWNSCVAFPLLQPFWPTSVPLLASSPLVEGTTSYAHNL